MAGAMAVLNIGSWETFAAKVFADNFVYEQKT